MWSGYYKKNIQNASYVEFRQVQKKRRKKLIKIPAVPKATNSNIGRWWIDFRHGEYRNKVDVVRSFTGKTVSVWIRNWVTMIELAIIDISWVIIFFKIKLFIKTGFLQDSKNLKHLQRPDGFDAQRWKWWESGVWFG